ncbi:MAG: hypothetical protein DMG44_07190 [Acidobacteria bacterium]|nr:MAG: hypothetical protein DMG44_07190 [Acidobacteriota bacterium]
MHSLRETGTSRTASEFHTETGPYYYRARYYDANVGRFISEDKWDVPMNELVNLYAYVPGNAINFSDPLGQFTLKPGMNLPWPNLRLQALLECIEFNTGIPLIVTSTTNGPPTSPHGPNDVHRGNGGLAVDISYPE